MRSRVRLLPAVQAACTVRQRGAGGGAAATAGGVMRDGMAAHPPPWGSHRSPPQGKRPSAPALPPAAATWAAATTRSSGCRWAQVFGAGAGNALVCWRAGRTTRKQARPARCSPCTQLCSSQIVSPALSPPMFNRNRRRWSSCPSRTPSASSRWAWSRRAARCCAARRARVRRASAPL